MAFSPLVVHGLTEDLISKAKRELNEDEERKATALKKLKELIRDGNSACCTDDDFLVMFLRNKKYDPKKSFLQLKSYTQHRRSQLKYLTCDDFDTIQKVLDSKVCGLLPKRDHEERVIVFFRASQFSSCDYSGDDVMLTVSILCHFALSFPATQVSGFCFIADAAINSVEVFQLLFKYLRIFVPNLLIFPARFKRVDCINTNVLFRACFHLVRPLIPSKLLRRTTLHGDSKDSLLQIYPPDILPKEFGGTLEDLEDLQHTWIPELKKFIPNLAASNLFYEKPCVN